MRILNHLKNSFIIQAWLVLTLALLFGAALASVKITLEPTIAANKKNEILQKLPEIVLGADLAQQMVKMDQELLIDLHAIKVDKEGNNIIYNVYEARHPNKMLAGWVVKTAGQGYADKIEMLLGLGPLAESITGLFILDQKETPGLGNKITTQQWRQQFINKSTSQPLTAVKSEAKAANEIDAVTGATISSRSVCQIINTAIHNLRAPLAAKAVGGK